MSDPRLRWGLFLQGSARGDSKPLSFVSQGLSQQSETLLQQMLCLPRRVILQDLPRKMNLQGRCVQCGSSFLHYVKYDKTWCSKSITIGSPICNLTWFWLLGPHSIQLHETLHVPLNSEAKHLLCVRRSGRILKSNPKKSEFYTILQQIQPLMEIINCILRINPCVPPVASEILLK